VSPFPIQQKRSIECINALRKTGDTRAATSILVALWPCMEWRPPATRLILPRSASMHALKLPISNSIRLAAEEALNRFVATFPAEQLAEFDQAVRNLGRDLWAGASDKNTWKWWVETPSPRSLTLTRSRTSQLCLLACHANGHVREEAIVELASTREPVALRFLILRSTDWVTQVADRAAAAAQAQIALPESSVAVLQSFPLLSRLSRSARASAQRLLTHIKSFLLSHEQQSLLVAALASPDRHTSRVAASLIEVRDAIPSRAIIDAVSHSRDAVTRSSAMAWELVLRESAPNIAFDLRKLFLRDSAAGLRAKALQAHVDTNGDAETLHSALLDSSAAVRQTARYYLRDKCDKNYFAELYRGVITSRDRKNLATAAAGLGEVGSVFDAAFLQSLLEASPRVARAALRSLAKLDPTGAHVTLMEKLGDSRPGVQREALGLIDKRLSEADAAKLRQQWKASPKNRRPIALAMLRLPNWLALQLLLDGAFDDPLVVEQPLLRWRPESRRGYAPTRPSDQVGKDLRRAFAGASSVLPAEISKRIDKDLTQWAGV
jgi:hypothetical protein